MGTLHNHLDHYFTSAIIVLPKYQDPVNVIQISYFHPIMFNNCEDTILLQLDLAELMMQTAKEQFLYFQYITNEEVTAVGKHCGLRCNVYLIALVYMNLFETKHWMWFWHYVPIFKI